MEYFGFHRPGNPQKYPDEVATIDKLSSENFFPKGYVDEIERYIHLTKEELPEARKEARKVANILKNLQGKPDEEVTIYRGSPKGELNQGDWVTLSKEYASLYAADGIYSGSADSKVYSFTSKAKELSFDGDSIFEFGYWGSPQKIENML